MRNDQRTAEVISVSAICLALTALLFTASFLTAADLALPQRQQQQQQQQQQKAEQQPGQPVQTPAEGPARGDVQAEAPANKPASATTGSAPPAAAAPAAIVLDSRAAAGILGREVRSAADENMGRIVDVIVDRDGTVRAAVIDFGGFLGVGSRKIVVDWRALHFGAVENKKDSISLELTKEQVSKAPEYKEDQQVIVLGAAGSLQPWEFDH